MGNPLLDITVNNGDALLEKYEMEANTAILAEEKHKPMYKEMVDNYEVEYTAGGATQNTMRIIQWMVGLPNIVSFMGCIGKDKFGEVLEKEATSASIIVKYQYNTTEPTGTCAVVLTSNGTKRSLCANLAAANLFHESHLEKEDNFESVKSAQFYYISGFFITVSPNSMLKVAKHANEFNKVFSINLSAPFICQFFKEPLSKIIPYADIIFGNESEAAEFAKHQNIGVEKISDIALFMSEMEKVNVTRRRMVVITQGDDQIVVAYDGKVNYYNPTKVPADEIVDTNGAGDAFVAGFLSQLIQGKTTDQCIKGGVYAATVIIKRSGVTCA
ncbi:Adenosine kinase 2 [Nymphon striatum]|nr:Adenosine kinase 2 [Nymphon striatum]